MSTEKGGGEMPHKLPEMEEFKQSLTEASSELDKEYVKTAKEHKKTEEKLDERLDQEITDQAENLRQGKVTEISEAAKKKVRKRFE